MKRKTSARADSRLGQRESIPSADIALASAWIAELVDGKLQVTPAQIPSLVPQHLSWIKPSAGNRMFNAELVEIRSPGQRVEPTAYPTDAAFSTASLACLTTSPPNALPASTH
ncbi:hypothetical protein [Streptomyces sp. R-74717]|uniref:hypothetical protein n=1 Tax=Streptomyces sp. R-74717 TaxID=2969820 RepID=UPI0039B5DF86